MPSRPSRQTVESAYIKRAVPYHATVITVLWVTLLFLSIGFGMLLLVFTVRLKIAQQIVQEILRTEIATERDVAALKLELQSLKARATAPSASVSMPKTVEKVLTRGALSPDGKNVAGYDDVPVGKKGIGVRKIGETRVRHIEIFNPKTESSGAGTAAESSMSVRWKENQTIEYDVLVKKENGKEVQETRTTTIYF